MDDTTFIRRQYSVYTLKYVHTYIVNKKMWLQFIGGKLLPFQSSQTVVKTLITSELPKTHSKIP